MSDKPVVSRLEMHVTHACNLSCESCSHYSNHGHTGHVTLDQADLWMRQWKDKIDVGAFILLGGEPTIHPDLTSFVYLVRRHWPDALIQIITNGFFLERHPKLPQALVDCGRTALSLSIHHSSADYQSRVENAVQLVETWSRTYGISTSVTPSFQTWTRRYQGYGSGMLPFDDGDPERSWAICPAKYCRQLYDGMLWKCSPITYLRLQRHKFEMSDKWNPYLDYRPLSPDCDAASVVKFLSVQAEDICSMCPATRREFVLPDPRYRPQPTLA